MKIFAAFTLILGLLTMGISDANAHSRKSKYGYQQRYAAVKVKPQVRGYSARIGGYRYGYEPEAPTNHQVVLPSYPYFDDRTMWERVNSDPRSNSNEVGPSGF
jgi:hypothetical protein